MKISREHKLFLSSAIAASVISIIGFDIFARISIRSEKLITALGESLYFNGIQIVGTLMLIAPFLVLGGMAVVASKNGGLRRGWCFFICGVLPLMGLYLRGILAANHFLEQEKWTASSLSIGLLPFKSIPILFIGLGIGWAVSRLVEKKSI
jgi:hypothetical protein